MSRFQPYGLRRQGTSQTGPPPHERTSPYFLLFATDADRELKIPIERAATYRTLREGRPAKLRKCKVMITTFDRVHWFLVATRHSDDGARNHSINETMGFLWKGPLTVMRLERRGGNTPIGILTAEHHQAAIAAVERYLDIMSEELNRPECRRWRTSITDSDLADPGPGRLPRKGRS